MKERRIITCAVYRINRTGSKSGVALSSTRIATDAGCTAIRFPSTAASNVATEGRLDTGRQRHPPRHQTGISLMIASSDPISPDASAAVAAAVNGRSHRTT